MELSTRTAVFLLAYLVSINCVPVKKEKGKTAKSSLQDLDAANLETLNRETRKALLKLIGDELATTRAVMNSIQPEVRKCQQDVDQRFAECVHCVDLKCQNRYKECNGSIEIIASNSGGVSVSSSVNERGKPITTVCTVIWGQSDACTSVMNPDGIFATSVNNMGNNLHVHLQTAVNDLGENVGIFVNQMQSVAGDINGTQISNEELERMLAELNTGLSAMQFDLQHMMDGFGQNMHQSMNNMGASLSQIGPNVQQSLSGIGPNINRRVHQATSGLSQIGPNINRRVHQATSGLSQIGPNINRRVQQATSGLSQIGPNINRQMSGLGGGLNNMFHNLHHGLGQWGQNFGQSMNNMLSGMFGRWKRQAQIISDPSHEIRCENMFKNSTVCAEYRSKCQSCPQTSNVTEKDVINQVCGDVIVEKVMRINDKLVELTEIENTVVSSRSIIDRIEIDKTSWNADSFSFQKMFINTNIKGQPTRFSSKSALKILEFRQTGASIAKQIWSYWNDPAIQKPKQQVSKI